MFVTLKLTSLIRMLYAARKLSLIVLCSALMACGGGSSATPEPIVEEPIVEEPIIEEPVIEEPIIEEPVIEEPVIEQPAVEEPDVEEPVTEQPDPLSTQADSARAGKIAGVNIWQLPNSPDGDRPDQCWLAVGSDASGEIYISGHDHQTNSMLYRMYQSDSTVRWIGDARTASEAADNWENGETAEKFHTRPIHHDGQVYVATLDKSGMDDGFRTTRGFHWYSYKISQNRFYDLSAAETNGVGAETLQLATIQIDPVNNLLYGMSIPENKLVRYDIAQSTTTVLGKPDAWQGYFYTNRFMWVDSRGRVYITGGSSRSQWNKGESAEIFDHVWYYDPVTGFGELPEFELQGPNSMEVGQWDREHKNLYTSDDQGNIYRFNDAAASWTFLGRPDFPSSLKTWIFQLSADEEKIYIGLSDGSRPNAIYEYDIASGDSYELLEMTDLDDDAAAENFITGYDSWDSRGSFYIASFSMYDNDNVFMLGINPVEIKLEKGLITERIEVTAAMEDGGNIRVSRSGSTTASVDVLYEIRGSNIAGEWVSTGYGNLTIQTQQSGLSIDPMGLSLPTGGSAITYEFVVVPDGNDYLIGSDTAVDFLQ
jgi:hypothetical protein